MSDSEDLVRRSAEVLVAAMEVTCDCIGRCDHFHAKRKAQADFVFIAKGYPRTVARLIVTGTPLREATD